MFEMTLTSNAIIHQATARFDATVYFSLNSADANDPGATAETAGTIGNGA